VELHDRGKQDCAHTPKPLGPGLSAPEWRHLLLPEAPVWDGVRVEVHPLFSPGALAGASRIDEQKERIQ